LRHCSLQNPDLALLQCISSHERLHHPFLSTAFKNRAGIICHVSTFSIGMELLITLFYIQIYLLNTMIEFMD
jgi:hypothetical protein